MSTVSVDSKEEEEEEEEASLEDIVKVEIEPRGEFKYILLKVYDPDNKDSSIVIVRGLCRMKFNYHQDIYEEVQPELEPFEVESLGGGKISHDPVKREIQVFGYSRDYDRADHEVAAKLIKEAYPTYTVTTGEDLVESNPIKTKPKCVLL